VPVLVIAAAEDGQRARALAGGADDVLARPVSMRGLVTWVRAASRRAANDRQGPGGRPIEIEELVLDPRTAEAYVDGASAGLTSTEFRLLYALALQRGRVVGREELLQRIWGRHQTGGDRTIDVFVRRMRAKVDGRASRHTFIQTRRGVGYRLEPIAKRGA
jgi:DNA-binding response OmpR family regulator